MANIAAEKGRFPEPDSTNWKLYNTIAIYCNILQYYWWGGLKGIAIGLGGGGSYNTTILLQYIVPYLCVHVANTLANTLGIIIILQSSVYSICNIPS